MQHLRTLQDNGNWTTSLVVYQMIDYFEVLVDDYNSVNTDAAKQIHYLQVTVGYKKTPPVLRLPMAKAEKELCAKRLFAYNF